MAPAYRSMRNSSALDGLIRGGDFMDNGNQMDGNTPMRAH